jgi:hypothetical protein
MPMVRCDGCGQLVTVIVQDDGKVRFKFKHWLCAQRKWPSTPSGPFVDAPSCPKLEASIEAARKRGAL